MISLVLTNTTYRRIADEFIGNGSLEVYKYKSGSKLVSLFNNYFNFNDEYESGFQYVLVSRSEATN